jgi:hypothetical protein
LDIRLPKPILAMRIALACVLALSSLIASAQAPKKGLSFSYGATFGDRKTVEKPFDTEMYERYRENNLMVNYWFSPKFAIGTGISQVNVLQNNHRLGTTLEFGGFAGRVEARGVFPTFSDRFLFTFSGAAQYGLPGTMQLRRTDELGGDQNAVSREYYFHAGVSYVTDFGLMITLQPINLIRYEFSATPLEEPGRGGEAAVPSIQQNNVRLNYLGLRLDYFLSR